MSPAQNREGNRLNREVLTPDGEELINTLIKPTIAIPDEASNIHGISNLMVVDPPSFQGSTA